MPIETAAPDAAIAPAPLSLQAVNGWRGLGSLGVAFGHFSVTTGFMSVGDLVPLFLLVDLFFVLSGLLIAHAYTNKLRRASAIPEYLVRRFGRIWPVHAAMLGVLVTCEFLKGGLHTGVGAQFASPPFAADGVNSVTAIWTNLLLVHSLGIHHSGTWNYPSWSLSVELATYVAFAVLCLLRPSMRRTASLVAIVVSIAILVFVAPKHMRSTYDYGLFRCIAGFFAGALLYDLLRTIRLPSWPWPTVVECLAVALVAVWMAWGFFTPLVYAAPLVFCLFILAFIQGRGRLSQWLLAKPLQVLAELSFTIYMVHAVVLLMMMAALHLFERVSGVALFVTMLDPRPTPGETATIVQVLDPGSLAARIAIAFGYFACVLVASYGVYRLVEVPGRGLFGSLARRLAAIPLAPPAAALGAPVRADAGPTP